MSQPYDPSFSAGGAAANAGARFQAQLGALVQTAILADRPLDARFGLNAHVDWVRFETEAPVDDLLVATRAGGFVAIQAKTSLSPSPDPASPYGRTIEQMVRHWLSAQGGDASLLWNRPLDPSRDRLALVVGPRAPASIRIHLPQALRLASQPGGGAMNSAQRHALELFEGAARAAWGRSTREPYDGPFVAKLAPLVTVMTFDPDGADAAVMTANLEALVSPGVTVDAVVGELVQFSLALAAQRGGADRKVLRQQLQNQNAAVGAPLGYRPDIAALKAHSQAVGVELTRFEQMAFDPANPIVVIRECQAPVEAAALEGSLVLVGEPGAGKSGVLNSLARHLSDRGDVVQLAVDRYSVETLEGLSAELGLSHPIVDVLQAWDGDRPGWLIVDALDATRGGRGEGVFRTLIAGVLGLKSRWRVIASIRTFDLRMGQQFRALFEGAPPVADLVEPAFPAVRHVRIPPWTGGEFEQLLERAPTLAAVLDGASSKLRELVNIPFNTRLVSELMSDGMVTDFQGVSTQVELLQLYWEHRVERHGIRAETCLRRVVDAMVAGRALRTSRLAAADGDPEALQALIGEGVLLEVGSGRWIQFRHHLLFDFAAGRLLFDPADLVSGARRFAKDDSLGLMLAPALGFVLAEIWSGETARAGFWTAVCRILADEEADPVIRSTVGRLAVEFPTDPQDSRWLADHVNADPPLARRGLSHIVSALAVRLEDHPETPLAPWAALAVALTDAAAQVAGELRLLLYLLSLRSVDPSFRPGLGRAARALLSFGLRERKGIVSSAIEFVVLTYDTDPAVSRALLQEIFQPARFEDFGFDEIPALARQIAKLAAVDPDFAATVYRYVYGRQVNDDVVTRMGDSQILSLTSNARQDYEMAYYALGDFFPEFLSQSPEAAVDALVGALEGFVARAHPLSPELEAHVVRVDDLVVSWREDQSYIWAHDPEDDYSQDGEVLITKLLAALRSLGPSEALRLVDALLPRATLAVLWARMFLVAAERGGVLLRRLWPWAAQEGFLVAPDTRKDAIDVVAAGWAQRTEAERIELERAALAFDFSAFTYVEEARQGVLRRLFGQIGVDNLVTPEAAAVLEQAAEPLESNEAKNERLFVIHSNWGDAADRFDWIPDLDRAAPVNAELMDAIETAKAALSLEGPSARADEALSLPLGLALAALEALAGCLRTHAEAHAQLRRGAEAALVEGVNKILRAQILPKVEDDSSQAADRLLALIEFGRVSAWPELNDDTEAEFERHASWGGPAPRVDAATAIADLLLARPDLHSRLGPAFDALLRDPHPAVRLQAQLRIVRLWDRDRDGFWARLESIAASEPNLEILRYFVDGVLQRVLHNDPPRVQAIALTLCGRFRDQPKRAQALREHVADTFALLWVSYGLAEADAALKDWLADLAAHHGVVAKVLSRLRTAVVFDDPRDAAAGTPIRVRALGVFRTAVESGRTILDAFHAAAPDPDPAREAARADLAKSAARVVDVACREFYFAIGASGVRGDRGKLLPPDKLQRFLDEAEPVLKAIGDCGAPHTIYYLSQTLQVLIPSDPGRVFDLLANGIRNGGRVGYQFEQLGSDLLVRLVGTFLADHREVFEDPARRAALIDCLELFMQAGWPSARRLLYRLPELLQ